MPNIFENIGRTAVSVGRGVASVGQGISNVGQGVFGMLMPAEAQQYRQEAQARDLNMQLAKIREAGGLDTEAGQAMIMDLIQNEPSIKQLLSRMPQGTDILQTYQDPRQTARIREINALGGITTEAGRRELAKWRTEREKQPVSPESFIGYGLRPGKSAGMEPILPQNIRPEPRAPHPLFLPYWNRITDEQKALVTQALMRKIPPETILAAIKQELGE